MSANKAKKANEANEADPDADIRFNIADFALLEPEAIKWVQWFRANCPNMRVKMYKKHASTLMANNIASTARLQLVIGDDPDVLTKKFGFDKYDAEDMGKVLKEGSRSGSIEGGDSKGSHHHGHHQKINNMQ